LWNFEYTGLQKSWSASSFWIAEEKIPEEQCFEQRLELKFYGILLLSTYKGFGFLIFDL
jgi:hypothetical protein